MNKTQKELALSLAGLVRFHVLAFRDFYGDSSTRMKDLESAAIQVENSLVDKPKKRNNVKVKGNA